VAQFLHSLRDVYLLRDVRTRPAVPEVPLVEEVHDIDANCMIFDITAFFRAFHHLLGGCIWSLLLHFVFFWFNQPIFQSYSG